MKLLVFLMLTALLHCCSAGSGCQEFEELVDVTVRSGVSVEDYLERVKEYITDESTERAVTNMKKCFIKQSQENQDNINILMRLIYNSEECKEF